MKKEKLQQIIQKYYLYYHKNVRNDHKKILSATILEKEMTTHSSILAWKIPWTEEPGGLYHPWGCKELDMTDVT